MIAKSHREKDAIIVLSVATNVYLDYWKQLVLSADKVTESSDKVCFWIFTDKANEAKDFAQVLFNVSINVFEIPPYGWPEATILRYEIFSKRVNEAVAGILIYLDADMLIEANPWDLVRKSLKNSDVCLVEHPGYWRPKRFKFILNYIQNPRMVLSDSRSYVAYGGRGKWERRSKSSAYVPRSLRKKYYCGGIWFGRPKQISEMISELASNVESDRKNGIIAVWHDESHLNQWAARNNHNSESPSLCYDETYPQLSTLYPLIYAVRKNGLENR